MKKAIALTLPVLLLGACSSMPSSMDMPRTGFSQASVPAPVQVPAGNKVALETTGVGEITYQCREKPNAAGQYEWFFAGPKAALNNGTGNRVGSYYGPPATWESMDGSKITGTQVAVAPNGSGNIPYQLVKANPAVGQGAMTGITYVQRVATRGGVAPSTTCNGANLGQNEVVKYQADYIFWSAV